jgi:hypothetical protein
VGVTVLVIPGVLLPAMKMMKYGFPFWTSVERDIQSWNDKCLFVTLSMIALAGLAVVNWDALRPNRRDQMVLGPLPVRAGTVLWAKLMSLGMLMAVFAAAVTGVAPVTFPAVMFGPSSVGIVEGLRWTGAHAVASLAAAVFGFCAIVSAQGVLASVSSPAVFRRAGAWLQFSLVFGLAIAFLLLPLITNAVEPLRQQESGAMFWLPPMWFLGLYQWLGGRGDEVWTALARLAAAGVAISVLVAISTHVIGYRRHATRLLESHESGGRRLAPLRAIGAGLARLVAGGRPGALGFFAFTVHTLIRSARHRLVLAASLAAGCALSVVTVVSSAYEWDKWDAPTTEALLSVQLLLAFCAVFGLRIATAIPSDLRANWTFRLLDPGQPGPWLRGFRRAAFWCGLVPLLLIQLPANAVWLGWNVAGLHALAGVVLGAIILETLFLGFRKVPFACAFVSGSGTPKARWAFYWFGFTTYAFALAAVEVRAIRSPVAFSWFLFLAVVVLAALVVYRNRRLGEGFPSQFDDESEWQVQTLNLGAGS